MRKYIFSLLIFTSLSGFSSPFIQGKISDPRYTQSRISEPKSQEEHLNTLFTYATIFFSEMIYGKTFIYQPTHHDRGIQSQFQWGPETPLADERKISVFDITRDELFMTAYCRYDLSTQEQRRVESANPGVRCKGAAAISFLDNYDSLPLATVYEKVCQEAVKSAAKSTIKKRKPREIHGRLVLENVPSIALRSGEYFLQASFRIEFTEIEYFDYF